MPLHPASGTGIITEYHKAIRFVKYGCTNRPFWHIVVMDAWADWNKPPIEQLGTYDKIPNAHNERLFAVNYERLIHWIGYGAKISPPLLELLGEAGIYPIHPRTYISSWRARRKNEEAEAEKLKTLEEEAEKQKAEEAQAQ